MRKKITSLLVILALSFVFLFSPQPAAAQSESVYGGSCNYWAGWCGAVAHVPNPGFGYTLTATFYTYRQGNSFQDTKSVYCYTGNTCQVSKYIEYNTQVQGVVISTTEYHDWCYVAPFT